MMPKIHDHQSRLSASHFYGVSWVFGGTGIFPVINIFASGQDAHIIYDIYDLAVVGCQN